jgi:phospholipase/lecithinase/hemolysin
MLRRIISRTWTALAANLLMHSSAQAASTLKRIVVFGDSLSDTGNAGRFSDGPVWVEYLARRFGLELTPSQRGGSNFAVGGARLDPRSGPSNLRVQADLFLSAPRRHGRTLHIVCGGGNDLLAAVGTSGGPGMIDAAIASLRSIVSDLAEQGATDILVPNLPDIGITPEVRAHGPAAVDEARRLTERFNVALDGALAGFAGISNLRLHRLDVREMAERVRADPATFGFADITTACPTRNTCKGYLFWDGVHPTTQAHGRLAQAAFHVLSSQ